MLYATHLEDYKNTEVTSNEIIKHNSFLYEPMEWNMPTPIKYTVILSNGEEVEANFLVDSAGYLNASHLIPKEIDLPEEEQDLFVVRVSLDLTVMCDKGGWWNNQFVNNPAIKGIHYESDFCNRLVEQEGFQVYYNADTGHLTHIALMQLAGKEMPLKNRTLFGSFLSQFII